MIYQDGDAQAMDGVWHFGKFNLQIESPVWGCGPVDGMTPAW